MENAASCTGLYTDVRGGQWPLSIRNVDGTLRCVIQMKHIGGKHPADFDIISIREDVKKNGVETRVWRIDRPQVWSSRTDGEVEVIVVGSDAPGGRVPFQEPDPALSAPRSYVDQYGRPILREYVVQKQPAARGPVQGATSRPFNLLEPNIVHGSHLQARRFGGPDAPFNIVPAPKGINLGPMSQIEGDLSAMIDLDQEIYVQQYQQYEGMQRIPTDTTYRIFRKFEGTWRLLQEKTVPILH
jgi:hypothetical protein